MSTDPMPGPPRLLVVHRRPELAELLERHGTRGQAEFFLRSRGRDLGSVQSAADHLDEALRLVRAAVPAGWRAGSVERADLPSFLFDPGDLVVVVGQDGLVANVAKYLHGQPVLGVDPEPGRNPGVLVRHTATEAAALVPRLAGGLPLQQRCMVEAVLDDGQRLAGLNEVYVGHPSHQSARYRIGPPGAGPERQSSSGLLVGTGTGATGWCASVARERATERSLPALPQPEEPRLAWFVREAWPSPVTGTTLTSGSVGPGEHLEILVESDGLVAFADGLESDRLLAGWGQQLSIGLAGRTLALVA
jgi:hypothetical protein